VVVLFSAVKFRRGGHVVVAPSTQSVFFSADMVFSVPLEVLLVTDLVCWWSVDVVVVVFAGNAKSWLLMPPCSGSRGYGGSVFTNGVLFAGLSYDSGGLVVAGGYVVALGFWRWCWHF
jgi:hypothetical protein